MIRLQDKSSSGGGAYARDKNTSAELCVRGGPICGTPRYIYSCCCSVTSKQELQKAVAEIGNWKTSCEHLGVYKAVLNGLDNIIDTAGTLKKSRSLEAYLNMSTACILYAPDCTLLWFH